MTFHGSQETTLSFRGYHQLLRFSRSFLYEGKTPKERRKNIKGAFASQTVTNFFSVKFKVSFKFLSRNRNICTWLTAIAF